MKRLFILICSLTVCLSLWAKKGPSAFVSASSLDTLESVLNAFPYESYTRELKEKPLSYLVNDVLYLKESGASTGLFLDSVFIKLDQQISKDPKDLNNLKQIVRIGEGLLYLDDISINTFPAFGDLLLQRVTNQIETGIEEELYIKNDPEITYLIRRLQDQQFFVKIQMSDWEKGWNNLKNGNFQYLFRKVKLKQPLLYYGFIFTLSISLGLGIIFLIRRLIFKRMKIAID